jgi:TolB-like protein
MNSNYSLRILLKPIMTAVLGLTLIADLHCAQDNKPTLAVLDFEPIGVDQITAKTLTERFRTVTVEIGAYTVISRGDMDQILQEQQFQLSGCASDECIVEVGKILGAQYMLGASLGRVGDTYTIDMRIIDVESSEIVRSTSFNMAGKIDKLLTDGLKEVAGIIFNPPSASITIISTPRDAVLTLNEILIGPTPQTLPELLADSIYSVRLKLPNYEVIDTTFVLKRGENSDLKYRLIKEMALLSMIGLPAGVPVSANNDTIGILPLQNVPLLPGAYAIVIKQPGYNIFEETILLEYGVPNELQVNLIQKTRFKASQYSLVFPGFGQIYAENHKRGWAFIIGTIATSYLCFNSYSEFWDEKDILDAYHAEYMAAMDYETLEVTKTIYLDQLSVVQSLQRKTNLYGTVLGVSWTFNIADAYFGSSLLR